MKPSLWNSSREINNYDVIISHFPVRPFITTQHATQFYGRRQSVGPTTNLFVDGMIAAAAAAVAADH